MKTRSLPPLLLAALLLASCTGDAATLRLEDDHHGRSAALLSPDGILDAIGQPWAADSTVTVSLVVGDGRPAQGVFVMASSDPAVVEVTAQSAASYTCRCRGEGEATLVVRNAADHEVRRARVVVKRADRARVYSHTLLRLLGFDAPSYNAAEVHEARIVGLGTAVYAAVFYRGEERLWGGELARADAGTAAFVRTESTSEAEWLFVTPAERTSFELGLRAGATPVGSLHVEGVAMAEVVALEITPGAGEAAVPSGDNSIVRDRWVIARGRDTQGRAVDGINSTWTVESGPPLGATGDLLAYAYDEAAPAVAVRAQFMELAARATIQRAAGSPPGTLSGVTVYRDTDLGCAIGGHGGGGPFSIAACALLGALVYRRIRRRVRPR